MKFIIGLCLLLIIATMAVGVFYYFQSSIREGNKKLKVILGTNVSIYIPLVVLGTIIAFSGTADAAEAAKASASNSAGLGYIAAALSTGLATIGAGYAVGSVGSSALGAVSEDPKILGKTLIFVGLAEGIGKIIMKSFLLCEKKETLLSMRLAGIGGKMVSTKEEIENSIEELLMDDDIGLILVSENILSISKEFIMDKKLAQKKKLIIQIPEPEGLKDKDYIMKYIKNSIGIKL